LDQREFLNLIKKYKKSGCSPREKELLETYLESFQNNQREWIESEMGNQKLIEEKIYPAIMKKIAKGKSNFVSKIFFSPLLLKRAASIVLFLILVTGILYISGIIKQSDSIVWNEKVTSSGEKFVLVLSEGTKVTLNADTKLRYPENFNHTNREVYLQGEAYFEVSHNPKRPFIVRSGNILTTVLGTKFNVSAFSNEKNISISLLEGKVKISKNKQFQVEEIAVLKPKQQLLYDKENNISSFEQFDSLEAVGWKDNIYKFANKPLGEVLSQLERAFGVKFSLADKSFLTQKITIKFEKNSLQTVIDVIKNLTGLNYKIVKEKSIIKEVLFFKNNN
jgi:transmembrane sensor